MTTLLEKKKWKSNFLISNFDASQSKLIAIEIDGRLYFLTIPLGSREISIFVRPPPLGPPPRHCQVRTSVFSKNFDRHPEAITFALVVGITPNLHQMKALTCSFHLVKVWSDSDH